MKKMLCLLMLLTAALCGFSQVVSSRTSLLSLTAGNNELGRRIFGQLAEEQPGNIVFSPVSIYSALSLLFGGSAGTTETEMREVMGIEVDFEDFYGLWDGYQRQLMNQGSGSTVQFSQSLWPDHRVEFFPEYLRLIKDFCPEIYTSDFSAPEGVRIQINDWVAEHTRGKILDIVPEGGIWPFPYNFLAAVNAVTFDGVWEHRFDPEQTTEETFHGHSEEVEIPMMHAKGSYDYIHLPDYKVLSIPYSLSEFRMILVLPDREVPLGEIEGQLDAETLTHWQEHFHRSNVRLTLPRFDITCGTYDLKDKVKTSGLWETCGEADFSNLLDRSFTIESIFHKAHILNEEEGTSAEAATVITGCFPAGTPIHTPEGLVPIEEVRPGTEVVSLNLETGAWETSTVNTTERHRQSHSLLEIHTGDDVFFATGNHPVLCLEGSGLDRRPVPLDIGQDAANNTQGTWVAAENLRSGDRLTTFLETETVITEIREAEPVEEVYNLSLEGNRNYLAGSSGFVVHNKGGQDPEPYLEDFNIDRPFLFFIKDNRFNGILFMGRINSLPQ